MKTLKTTEISMVSGAMLGTRIPGGSSAFPVSTRSSFSAPSPSLSDGSVNTRASLTEFYRALNDFIEETGETISPAEFAELLSSGR